MQAFITKFLPLQILNEIAQHKIKIYEFPECDDEEENKIQKKLRVSTQESYRNLFLEKLLILKD